MAWIGHTIYSHKSGILEFLKVDIGLFLNELWWFLTLSTSFKLVGISFSLIFLYYIFHVCRICSDVFSVILNIGNLCLLSFLINLPRGLYIVLIFPNEPALASLIFVYFA